MRKGLLVAAALLPACLLAGSPAAALGPPLAGQVRLGRLSVISTDARGLAQTSILAGTSVANGGRFVEFWGTLKRTVTTPIEHDRSIDVFVHKLATDSNELVSEGYDGEFVEKYAESNMRGDAISADGRFVAFQSSSSRLVRGRSGGVFIRDRRTGTTISVTRFSAQVGPLTADGRTIFFMSEQHVLPRDANPGPRGTDIYAFDVRSRRISYVDIGTDGRQMKGGTAVDDISPSGRFVLFDGRGGEWLRDRVKRSTTLVTDVPADFTSTANFQISADARYMSFNTESALSATDTNGEVDCYVLDRSDGTYREVTDNTNAKDPGLCTMSPDGRLLALTTTQALLPQDHHKTEDLYLLPIAGGAPTLVSSTPSGTAGNGASGGFGVFGGLDQPAFSRNGDYIVFATNASNLIGRKGRSVLVGRAIAR
jgi:Tol biopolymer transport system component